jgi:hypothetical protein
LPLLGSGWGRLILLLDFINGAEQNSNEFAEANDHLVEGDSTNTCEQKKQRNPERRSNNLT